MSVFGVFALLTQYGPCTGGGGGDLTARSAAGGGGDGSGIVGGGLGGRTLRGWGLLTALRAASSSARAR